MNNQRKITKLQEEIVDFVSDMIASRGYPPSFREIAKHCWISSIGSVHYHIEALKKCGYLQKEEYLSRGLRLAPRVMGIPIIGRVIAGVPVAAHQNIEGYIDPATFMIGKKGMFALKVHGDSMIDAGILEGDIAVVNEQKDAFNKDIVVAMVDDEATIKYFYKDSDAVRLEPANIKYKPIIGTNITIVGKVVKIIRNY